MPAVDALPADMLAADILATSWLTPQLVVDGFTNGLVIGLLAIGIVLVHRTSQVVNFAVGAMGVIGASLLALLVLQYDLSFWSALPVVLVAGTAYGGAVELAVVRRLFDAPRVILLVATIGIAGLSVTVTELLPTPDGALAATYPVGVSTVWDDVAGVRVTGAQLSIVVVVPLVAAALGWFLAGTSIGRAVTASADNPRLARTMGINPRLVSTGVWAASGLLSTLSMVLVSGQAQTVTGVVDLGPNVMLRALAAFLLAGMTSFPRAMAAGVAIGVAEAVVRFNFLSQAGLVDLGLFVVVLVAVWCSTRRTGGGAGGLGGFAPAPRPVPAVLAGRWWARHLGTITGAVALGGGLVLAVTVTSPSRLQLFAVITAFAICASSLTLLTGWAGQASLGQMAFAGLGALVAAAAARGAEATVGWGSRSWTFAAEPVPFVVAAVIGAATAAVVAAVVGLGALRVRGMLLAVSTFAFAVVASQWVYRRPFLSGGGSGSVPFRRGDLLVVDLDSERAYLLVVLVVAAVVLTGLARLRSSGFGRSVLAVRDNPTGAAALTVAPTAVTMRTFALSGGIAGLGGALLAGAVETVPFADRWFGVGDSLDLLAMVVIGGLGSLAGAVLGAAWVVGLPALFPDDPILPLFASSAGLLVLLLYFPGGLAEIGRRAREVLLDALAARAGAPVAAPRRAAPGIDGLPARLRAAGPPAPGAAVDGAAGIVVAPRAPALAAARVTVAFDGITAVDGVSLEVAAHEVVGLIGANGAGKSTLMNAICGFVPAGGRVSLAGEDITGLRPHDRARRGLGRTFQAARLFDELSVTDTVLVALESRRRSGLTTSLLGTPGARAAERAKRSEAAELIDLVGLGRYATTRIADLSTGTRRMVELACLIGLDARVLCLDEPTAGVAQRETEALGPLLVDVRRALGAAMVVIEHDMPFIAAVSDRLVCLEVGRVIAEGTPDEVRGDPRVVASYLGTDTRAIERSTPA